ncbi:hypothetical protein [Paenibacillus sp. GCM10027626]|uniref:hypothetical protein n=1 Tax=Paenibacillus sp. GCM10027626 TaxID=3273411 RepID=UPI00363BFCA9
MQKEKERFCCVCCFQLLSFEQAHIVFRTGFYRIIHPLGCCGHCAQTLMDKDFSELASARTELLPKKKEGNSGFNPDTSMYSSAEAWPLAVSL